MNNGTLSIGEIIRGGASILAASPIAASIGGLAAVALELASVYLLEVQERTVISSSDQWWVSYGPNVWFSLLLYWVCYVGLSIAVTSMLLPVARAQGQSAENSVGRRWTIAAGVSVAVAVGTVLGLIFFVIPGLLLMARWYIAVPVALDRSVGVGEAMSRSWDATKPIAWRLVFASLVVNAPFILISVTRTSGQDSGFAFWARLVAETSLSTVAIMMGLAMAVYAYRHLLSEADDLRAVFH